MSDETETTTEIEDRKLDVILNLDVSELTASEIEKVINYKADLKARDEQFNQILQQQEQAQNAMLEMMKEQFENAKSKQDEFLELSLSKLRAIESNYIDTTNKELETIE